MEKMCDYELFLKKQDSATDHIVATAYSAQKQHNNTGSRFKATNPQSKQNYRPSQSTGTHGTRLICQFCDKPGHSAKWCRKIKPHKAPITANHFPFASSLDPTDSKSLVSPNSVFTDVPVTQTVLPQQSLSVNSSDAVANSTTPPPVASSMDNPILPTNEVDGDGFVAEELTIGSLSMLIPNGIKVDTKNGWFFELCSRCNSKVENLILVLNAIVAGWSVLNLWIILLKSFTAYSQSSLLMDHTPRKDSVSVQHPSLDDSPLPPHTPQSLAVNRVSVVEQDLQSVGKGRGKRLKTWFD
ncbi:hypothetical protein COLO4_17196 [Corchorus olitorius]|uniref:Zinc finger, CCHC-type n=1 Tax=Corchorus olitorius TaxID=93759 RepID=A0A1R3JDL4_9ROSI|nr:hypothetical protein COLO4_17196 [Corchorus olitorius]